MAFRPQYIDLAAPATQPQPTQQQVTLQPPITSDSTVAAIATVLAAGAVGGAASAATIAALTAILAPYAIAADAIVAAYGLAMQGGIPALQEASQGIVRYNGDGSINEGNELAPEHLVRLHDNEWNYRAAYFANAAKRISHSMDDGEGLAEAVHDESQYYRMHVKAADMRGKAIAQAQTAANVYGTQTDDGTLVGWYRNPLLKSEAECLAADGNNYYAERGTRIGYPGTVHAGCGCYTGPPHPDGEMVDDATSKVVHIGRGKPAFKLKRRA